jgi:hypothetical protein
MPVASLGQIMCQLAEAQARGQWHGFHRPDHPDPGD